MVPDVEVLQLTEVSASTPRGLAALPAVEHRGPPGIGAVHWQCSGSALLRPVGPAGPVCRGGAGRARAGPPQPPGRGGAVVE